MKLPNGFTAASCAAGLKSSGALDLTLVVNNGPNFDAAAVYTSNQVVAAPVIWSKQVTKDKIVRAAILNSGGANACTGPQGFADTHKTAEYVGELLNISSGEVVVCSTGLIGELLPMEKILSGIDVISKSLKTDALTEVAQAIMTTDSVAKIATYKSANFEVSGVAKGAGMLAPALATMLSVIMTDAVLPENAQEVFKRVCDRTYNRIDSDGCTSTNDTVILLSSGASGIKAEAEEFQSLLVDVCMDLARQLMKDAEGAAHEIAIEVHGAVSEADALEVGRAIARNNLVKTAIYGNDPNWGRILAAIGTTTAEYDPYDIDVEINGVRVSSKGGPDQDRSLVNLAAREVFVRIGLNAGDQRATILTNDLTKEYVIENSEYSS